MNIKPKWNKGAPPSIGWWPASVTKNENEIRWWNGEKWSFSVRPDNNSTEAGTASRCFLVIQPSYEWSERWWL